jgi:HSP20 family protein
MNVDIYENENELLVLADVPGLTQDKLNVSFENGELSLHGPQRRVFAVPHTIDTEHVAAELKNGVLRVTLPKAAASRARQIEIKSA